MSLAERQAKGTRGVVQKRGVVPHEACPEFWFLPEEAPQPQPQPPACDWASASAFARQSVHALLRLLLGFLCVLCFLLCSSFFGRFTRITQAKTELAAEVEAGAMTTTTGHRRGEGIQDEKQAKQDTAEISSEGKF
ncbi:GL26035 [Drosophila persimilis]|uniref:GL26035 n=1 Tax=Drosophila persimilis TaxID=7234 RepID=B4GK92_DROPE|nr:GL26035 [Drosophila persimilis]